ncbi:MAG: NADP(H)-dependent aldo-keto reductase, partial [Gammaproteobacteria bacterium]|nr:NADP(H)-dependent aldo-keto reductase [Gammaproteobacteria bacterium]
MIYRHLGMTNLKVSALCLGTMTFGEQNSEAEAHAQLDHAAAAGVNFIDTAEMYPVPPKATTQGLTEKFVGSWLAKRGTRDKLVLATKVAGPADWLAYLRDGDLHLDRKNIETAINGSLQRLQTDYIDLYQLHWPERQTNYFGKLGYQHQELPNETPLLETLQILDELVVAGKIRYFGVSNESPWGVMQFLKLSENHDLPRCVSIQNPYSLLNRTFEIGLAEIAHRETCGLLAYSPLGFGVLSGKYLNNARPSAARLTLFDRFDRYSNPQADDAVQAYVKLARQHDLDPAQMALSWVTHRSFVTSNIIGATTLQQLTANLQSIELELPEAAVDGIEVIHRQ